MILIIDNYDSFTYNLVQYFEEQSKEVLVVKNDKIAIGEIKQLQPEALVISPGPSTPDKAGISVDAVRNYGEKIPVLGVCLGHQAIAMAFEGRIVVNYRIMHGKMSNIYHDSRSIYEGVPNPFAATRYHSLIVEERTLPACLEVGARSEEGEIMGIRHKTWPVEGVQFHPESIMTREGKKVIGNFLRLSRDFWGEQARPPRAGCF